MPKLTCTKDYLMECGTVAFRSGQEYEWRWATIEEEAENLGSVVMAEGELGEHYLSYEDVVEICGGNEVLLPY